MMHGEVGSSSQSLEVRLILARDILSLSKVILLLSNRVCLLLTGWGSRRAETQKTIVSLRFVSNYPDTKKGEHLDIALLSRWQHILSANLDYI